MIRSLWIIYFIVVVGYSNGFSQNLLVNDSNGDLVGFSVNGCETNVIEDIGFYTDIAAHPNGFIYGINAVGKLTRINVETGQLLQVADFTSSAFYALTSNAEGLIFAASGLGDLVSYDPSINSTTVYPNMGFKAAGDLTYYQGSLYMATSENTLAYIDPDNPANNEVFIDFSSSGAEVYGIVSAVDGCDVQTYAFSNDANAKVFQIDWLAKSFNYVCEINHEVYGGSSEFEFAASDDLIQIDSIVINSSPCELSNSSFSVFASTDAGPLSYSIDGVNFQDSNEFVDIDLGTYTVYVQDITGCTGTETVTITSGFFEFEQIVTDEAFCGQNDGSANVVVNASTSDLMFSIDGINFQDSPQFSNLAPGDYTVTVIANGMCTDEMMFSVGDIPSIYIENIEAYQASCAAGTGIIECLATSPNGEVLYSLDNVNFTDEPVFLNLTEDIYTLYFIDEADCTLSITIALEESIFQLYDIIVEPVRCDSINGSAQIIVDTNLPSYELWVNGILSEDDILVELDAGDYEFTVQGADDCVIDGQFQIEEIPAFSLDTFLISPDFCGLGYGSVDAVFKPNGNILRFALDGQSSNDSFITSLIGGSYQMTVSDQNECVSSYEIFVPTEDCPVFIPNVFAPNDPNNDQFMINTAIPLEVEEFSIYDRWGNLVFSKENFSSTDTSVFWNGDINGTPAPAAVYVYNIVFKDLDQSFFGDITLIR